MTQTPHRTEARESLSEESRVYFDYLASDISHAARMIDESPVVSAQVIAALVRMGWRPAETSDPACEQRRKLAALFGNTPFNTSNTFDMGKFSYIDDPWWCVANGFCQAGDVLCGAASGNGALSSAFLFPMLFCYRHYLELSIKGLLALAARTSGKNTAGIPNKHTLTYLLQSLDSTLSSGAKEITTWEYPDCPQEPGEARVQTGSTVDDIKAIGKWASKLSNADDGSYRFRYPQDTKGVPHDFPDIQALFGVANLTDFRREMNSLKKALHGVSMAILVDVEMEEAGK